MDLYVKVRRAVMVDNKNERETARYFGIHRKLHPCIQLVGLNGEALIGSLIFSLLLSLHHVARLQNFYLLPILLASLTPVCAYPT